VRTTEEATQTVAELTVERLEALDQAMRAGDVTYAKARVLVPYLNDANSTELIEIAIDTPAGRLGVSIAAWLQRHEDGAETDRRHHRERAVSWRTDPDGMVTLSARLAPADATMVTGVIDQRVMRRALAPAGASLAQRRADAFVTALTEGGGNIVTEVVLHVRPDGNTVFRLAEGGTTVVENLQRLCGPHNRGREEHRI
jgi:hypothetical protein